LLERKANEDSLIKNKVWYKPLTNLHVLAYLLSSSTSIIC